MDSIGVNTNKMINPPDLLLESVLNLYSLLRGVLLSSLETARALSLGCNPARERGDVRPFYGPVTLDHVGQPGRRFPFSVFLEQLSERHRLTAFQLGIASQRVARD